MSKSRERNILLDVDFKQIAQAFLLVSLSDLAYGRRKVKDDVNASVSINCVLNEIFNELFVFQKSLRGTKTLLVD